MVNQKISALSALTKSTVATNDVLPIVDTSTGTTKNMTYGELVDVQDNNFRVSGSADNTKKVAFEVDGITTGTTRTITIPDASTTMVGTDTTQTMSGKTLTSPKVNVGADATGDMYYRDGSGNLARLPIGSVGQIIDVSAGGFPEWVPNPSASDASTTVKGVSEEATSAEVTSGASTGGTGAKLFITPAALAASGAYSKSVDVQAFTTAGTTSWTKPTGAKWVEVTVIGAGGGGTCAGGSFPAGGGGGSYGFQRFAASVLGSTETVIVGAGGAGTTGSTGTAGGSSSFGTTTLIKANGGNGGGPSGAAGTGGAKGNGSIAYAGGNGGSAGGSGVDTATDPSPRGGAAGNGGNGGGFITNYVKAGGTAGNPGNPGTTTSAGLLYGGVGGGGGNVAAAAGGAGGFPGGGGGGGGGSGAGAGGNGADGMVYVVTYF